MTDYWLQKLRDKSLQSFVGRTQELNALLSLLSTDGPDELITHVYGVGGVGKTSLLDRFESMARKQFNAVVRINEAQKNIRDVLVKIVQDLSLFITDSSEFSQNYRTFLRLEQQVQSDPAFFRALQESSGRVYTDTSGATDGSSSLEKEDPETEYDLSVVREMLAVSLDEVNIISFCYDHPEFRPVHDQLSNQMSKAIMLQHLIEYADRQLLMEKLIGHVRQMNPRQFERYQDRLHARNVFSNLTSSVVGDSFGFLDYVYQEIEDLKSRDLLIRTDHILSQSLVRDLVQISRQQRIFIIIDTYEFLAQFLDAWLRDEILARNLANLSQNLIFILAGREPLGPAWADYYPIIKQVELKPFSPAEAQDFLREKGITDPDIMQMMQDLSGNLPLMLALLVATPNSHADELTATQNVIDRFLKWIPRQDSTKREAVLACAFPRFFDETVIQALLQEIDVTAIFGWLQSFSFTSGRTGRWRYHSIIRRLIMQYQFDRNPEKYHEWHQTLVEYYRASLDRLGQEAKISRSPEALPTSNKHAQRYLGMMTNTLEVDPASSRHWRVLELEWIYHNLCRNEGFDIFVSLFLQSFRWSSYAQDLINTFMEAQEDLHERSNYYDWYILFKEVPQCRDAIDCSLPDWIPLLERLSEYEGISNPHERAMVFYQLGYHYTRQKRFTRAETVYREAIRLDPSYVSAYNGLGTLMRQAGDLDEAEKLYRLCLQLNESYIFPYYNLGQVMRQQGRIDEAEAFYRRSIELRPNLPFSYFNFGNFLREVRRYQDACEMYKQAVEMDPAHVQSHINLGGVLEQLGRISEARAEYEEALKLSPNEYLALLNMGLITGRHGQDPTEGLGWLDRCIGQEPDRLEAHLEKARFLEKLGRDREALDAYRHVDTLIPENPAIHYVIANLFERLGRIDEALERFGKYLDRTPNDVETLKHVQELKQLHK